MIWIVARAVRYAAGRGPRRAFPGTPAHFTAKVNEQRASVKPPSPVLYVLPPSTMADAHGCRIESAVGIDQVFVAAILPVVAVSTGGRRDHICLRPRASLRFPGASSKARLIT